MGMTVVLCGGAERTQACVPIASGKISLLCEHHCTCLRRAAIHALCYAIVLQGMRFVGKFVESFILQVIGCNQGKPERDKDMVELTKSQPLCIP